ncbi:MAG: hypothetical protein D6773_15115, partial [Alphaproteobacteria bacterium]
LGDLAGIPPERWGGLSFAPHPAVRRIDCMTNVDAVWGALHDGGDPPAVEPLEQPRPLIAFRPDVESRFRIMPADEAMMWDEAARGATFATLCELLAVYWGQDDAGVAARAAQYLQGWVNSGLLRRELGESDGRAGPAAEKGHRIRAVRE